MKKMGLQNMKITVVDYESGNLRSVIQALRYAEIDPIVSGNPDQILSADILILPGVGSGNAAMKALEQKQLTGAIREFIGSGRPFMGICLGLQLLMDITDEGGGVECLSVIRGTVERLPSEDKVPHMGWNQVVINKEHNIMRGINPSAYFYFAHSYYSVPADSNVVLGTTSYGIDFCSILVRDNVFATQFHPEKSGSVGLQIYKNFIQNAIE